MVIAISLLSGIGDKTEESLQLKIKAIAVVAGLSLLLEPWKPTIRLSMDQNSISLNNNWLIALVLMTTMVAMEVSLLTLLNTSKPMEVLQQKKLILIMQLIKLAPIEAESQQPPLLEGLSILLKMMKSN